MAPAKGAKAGCVGSLSFDPGQQVQDAEAREKSEELLKKDDLQGALTVWFGLPSTDKYVYHAMTSVRLAQVQHVVSMGGMNGLHAWYRDSSGQPIPPPPLADADAYITIFLASSNTASALKALQSNAKKGSVRLSVATYLAGKRFIHPGSTQQLTIPRKKSPPPNPYFDFWAWSSRNLEWCGPCPESETAAQSHHVLPIFMHHFGCAVPSYEALEILRIVADGRTVADIGSGNGYWTFMLRLHGITAVPVDNQQSEWRVRWVADTVIADGVKWLQRKENENGRGMVLLMVYPIVGGGVAGGVEGQFTRSLMAAFKGDTVAVVGTQNRNGYTGFRDMAMDEYMAREQPDWTKVVQIPLPSFAGKDEALFVFQKGDTAPKVDGVPS